MTALKSSRRKKKGQIGMMELFMVIFVLFIIIGVGMYFFYKYTIQDQKSVGEESCIQTSSEQLSSVLNIPEIKCSIQAHGRDCIDVIKLMAFRGSPSAKSLSRGLCQKSITFIQVYPPLEEEIKDVECDENNFKDPDYPDNCGKWIIFEPSNKTKQKSKFQPLLETPVSLYFPTLKEFRIGKLQLRLYIQ